MAKLFDLFKKKTEKNRGRQFLINDLPSNSVGCEVGVWKGDFSVAILEMIEPSKLYLVDPWLYQPEFTTSWYGGTVAQGQEDMDTIYKSVLERFKGKLTIEIIRKKTEDITTEIPDASLDWVYIDGNHAYEHVLIDLRTFDRKVKDGGTLYGDDYGSGKKAPSPVAQAVGDFLNETGYSLSWVKKRQFKIKKPTA